jgi:hypothetical protein
MNKEEKFVDWIESIVGQEIVDYNIEPKFDDDGNLLSYNIVVQPKNHNNIQRYQIRKL